ncbi:hypothetical protein RhiLY_09201 [Ceratobasidium sp. AG-Ba]|nr:hypothetical protein RhiLY_09201 [Ceratobasidium sp. AG-Ba]
MFTHFHKRLANNSSSESVLDTKDDHLVSGLYRGSITAVPGRETELYVWGCAGQNSNWVVLDWRSRRWRVIESISSSDAPGVRHAHTATYFSLRGESFIAILGGSANSPEDPNPPFPDVHIYNIKKRLWLPTPPSADSQAGVEQLTPRLFHSATLVDIDHEPHLAVVGGIFSDRTLVANVPVPTIVGRRALVLPELRFYNLRQRRWTQPVYVPGRYRHSAVLVPSSGRNLKLMIVGGRDITGGLSKETFVIDVYAAFQSLKYLSPMLNKPTPEDYGQGMYWSWLAGAIQPLGPYNGDCHLVPYGDSIVIFAALDRSAPLTHSQPISLGRRSSRSRDSRTESRTRPSEQPNPSYRSDSYGSHSGWSLSFSGGSVSFRELRKVRRAAQKAEIAALSIAELATQASVETSNRLLQPPAAPAFQMPAATPAPVPSIIPAKSSWLWCGVINSGWGTATGREEDLLLMVYQAERRICLVPVLLSGLGLHRSGSVNAADSTAITSLCGLLPPLWDGTAPAVSPKSYLSSTQPPFADFLIHSSTPDAPPLAVHRNILFSRSSYFNTLFSSGFNETRTGEARVDEGYAAAYAMCYWIYTGVLPNWLESPSAMWSGEASSTISIESKYAAHAGETLCELLIAANARMLPALATHVRRLLMECMDIPELAPFVWRAAELTDVSDTEDLVPLSQAASSNLLGRWVGEVIQSQMRPAEDRKEFMAAVSKWCCEGGPEVISAMEDAQDMLEAEVWASWMEKRVKFNEERQGGERCAGRKGVELPRIFEVPELLRLICSFIRTSDCARLARTCKSLFKIPTAFVWTHVDGGQNLLSLIGGTRTIKNPKSPGHRKIVIGLASSSQVDFSRFDIYASHVRILSVYGSGATSQYYEVDGWNHLISRALQRQRPLLPNLLSIILQSVCDGHGPDQVIWVKTFISPSLIKIQAIPSSFNSPPYITPLMADVMIDTIAQSCPRALKLSFFPSRATKYEENNLLGYLRRHPYYESLRTLPTLVELTCSTMILEKDSLLVISSMPCLLRLIILTSGTSVVLRPPKLPRQSFPALSQLHIRGLDPYEVISILSIPSIMSGLNLLELKFRVGFLDNEDEEEREEWIASELLSLLKLSPRLASLDLDLDPSRTNAQPYDIGHQDLMDIFSKLPLANVTMSGVHIGDWAYTGSLKTVWPNVTVLRMRDQFASPTVLSCFAQLPQLHHLMLNIFLEDFIECPKVPSLCPLHSLESSPGGSSVCEPDQLDYTSRQAGCLSL